MRRTKIVATLGPGSSSAEVIEEMIRAGVDVFRLNFSHGTHEEQRHRNELIRACSEKARCVPLNPELKRLAAAKKRQNRNGSNYQHPAGRFGHSSRTELDVVN